MCCVSVMCMIKGILDFFWWGLEFASSPLPELRVHRAAHSFAIIDFSNFVDCNAQNISFCLIFFMIQYDWELFTLKSATCPVTLGMEYKITTGNSYRFCAFLGSYIWPFLRLQHSQLQMPVDLSLKDTQLVESMSKLQHKCGRNCAYRSPCNGV